MSHPVDDLARELAQPMPRRRAVRIIFGAVVGAAFGSTRVGTAIARRGVRCPPPSHECDCPSINGLFYKTCCPPNYDCRCFPPPGGGAGCKCKSSLACGSSCCQPGFKCADSRTGFCCPPKLTPCKGGGNVDCCQADQVCCHGTCCRPGLRCEKGVCKKCPKHTKECGGHCCKKGHKCCYDDHCCANDETCCREKCCAKDQHCCGDHCCTKGHECCDKGCCAPGSKCAHFEGKQVCCPSARTLGNACCPPGQIAVRNRCCPKSIPNCVQCDPACPAGEYCVNGACLSI